MISFFLSIFFSTFVLEDLALVGGLALVSQGKMTLQGAFTACFFGIAVGDMVLFGVGRTARHFQNSIRFFKKPWFQNKIQKVNFSKLGTLIFSCRFVPGTRLPIYLGAGYFQYSAISFFLITMVSVLIWVSLAFIGGMALIHYFQTHWITLIVSLFVLIFVIKAITPLILDKWERKAFLSSWRKWSSFEFWPAWFFYSPILGYYMYLAARYKSLFIPMDANPNIKHGGFVGESKWDFYQHFLSDSKALNTFIVKNDDLRNQKILNLIAEKKIQFPFILKPDVGQRGFAVRIVRSSFDLESYLLKSDFDLIVQEYCGWQNEAGIFYYKMPGEAKGIIYSITDKQFPFLVGDGKTSIGQLILNDSRARIIAKTYLARHKENLDSIPSVAQIIPLSECGNHCQGAIFLNGVKLKTDELLNSIQNIADQMPKFFIGRFDIRYESKTQLMAGQGYKIVEVNGSGSEATHIWDPSTGLLEAYQVLFKQWRILFQIGQAVRDQGLKVAPVQKFELFKDIYSLTRKKGKLSLSS
ncbi:MAG: hypothetical protein WA160_10335 [Pseudobdellovibrio sp.]